MSIKTNTKLKRRRIYREKVNLLLFLSGKSISVFGSAIYAFAVGLYLLKTTGSGLTFATNIVLYTLPMVLLNPFAGVIADKINKKIVVVGSDLFNGVFILLVYFLIARNGLSVTIVYTSTFIITVLTIFFDIAIESAKPNLVSMEKLVNINSLARVIESSSYVAGPMIGGLIYAFIDMKLFILLNGISFILAAVLEVFIDYNYNKNKEKPEKIEDKRYASKSNGNIKVVFEKNKDKAKAKANLEIIDEKDIDIKKGIWFEMKEGYHYIFSRQHMKALLYVFTSLNFVFSFSITVPLPYLLNTTWRVESSIYGIIQGGFPVGMIIGALLVEKLMDRVSYSKLLKRINYTAAFGVLAFALPLIGFSSVPNQVFVLIYYTVLMLVSGVIVSWVDIPLSVLLQQIVPERILGRVISVKLSIVKMIVPIALLVSGYLVNLISPLFLFLIGFILFTSFNLWFFASTLGKKFISLNMLSNEL